MARFQQTSAKLIRWRRAVRVLRTAVIAVALVSCGCHAPHADPAHTPETRPIRFSYQNRIGSAIPIIAVEKSLFSKHGLTVVPSRFNSGPACAEALYTGAADIATMGDTTAIIALSRGAPLRLVASHAGGEHRHRIIVASDAPFTTIDDLVGKRIGIKKGTSTHGGFLKFLTAHGVAPDQIDVVDLNPDTMVDALAAGSIDAFAASEPTPSLGEMRGGRELATFGKLGNTYPIVMLATETLVSQRPDEIAAFLAALQEAERFIEANRGEAISLLAKSIGLPEEVTARALDRHRVHLNLDTSTLESLHETAEFLKTQGIIDALPEFQPAGPLADGSSK